MIEVLKEETLTDIAWLKESKKCEETRIKLVKYNAIEARHTMFLGFLCAHAIVFVNVES